MSSAATRASPCQRVIAAVPSPVDGLEVELAKLIPRHVHHAATREPGRSRSRPRRGALGAAGSAPVRPASVPNGRAPHDSKPDIAVRRLDSASSRRPARSARRPVTRSRCATRPSGTSPPVSSTVRERFVHGGHVRPCLRASSRARGHMTTRSSHRPAVSSSPCAAPTARCTAPGSSARSATSACASRAQHRSTGSSPAASFVSRCLEPAPRRNGPHELADHQPDVAVHVLGRQLDSGQHLLGVVPVPRSQRPIKRLVVFNEYQTERPLAPATVEPSFA